MRELIKVLLEKYREGLKAGNSLWWRGGGRKDPSHGPPCWFLQRVFSVPPSPQTERLRPIRVIIPYGLKVTNQGSHQVWNETLRLGYIEEKECRLFWWLDAFMVIFHDYVVIESSWINISEQTTESR